jgi:hypothetical protein
MLLKHGHMETSRRVGFQQKGIDDVTDHGAGFSMGEFTAV